MSNTDNKVKSFYDSNTSKFLRLKKDRQTPNIHQPLHAPGIVTIEEASNYSNQLIVDAISKLQVPNPHILDLGCGVGGSLAYLAKHNKTAQLTGITISPKQVEIGNKLLAEQGFNNCQLLEGDFQQLPDLDPVDLAFSIEAFVHSPNAKIFFKEIAKKLKSGGKLIIIDDSLTERYNSKISNQELELVNDFKEGWITPSLHLSSELEKMANIEGFILLENNDLTPMMRIGRPRDKFFGFLLFFFKKQMKKSKYFQMIAGGYAKQQCIKKGIVKYRMFVFEKM